jgi:uncharacterized membrane protein (DUF4010 family)
LLLPVGVPLIGACAVAAAFALFRARYHPSARTSALPASFRNPFGFWSVIAMAGLMSVLIVVGRLLREHFGDSATIGGAAAMGLLDVDAMTVSMARLATEALTPRAASMAILAGVASNTVLKVLIAASVGRARFALHVAGICGACIAIAAALMWLT